MRACMSVCVHARVCACTPRVCVGVCVCPCPVSVSRVRVRVRVRVREQEAQPLRSRTFTAMRDSYAANVAHHSSLVKDWVGFLRGIKI